VLRGDFMPKNGQNPPPMVEEWTERKNWRKMGGG
jgi:hypothetical protein